ncbi:c6 zinc finger domain-containing protein [Exophiala viscosa]|uniref:C6 zinc finger domain-containing protein n=1 Tax=Exophiala viscosa TaxID=2486360 RepID=A0AAN6DQE8_9EURO|nr:c6 zinc finger domain-containing protein [Exophiala viscosa]
MALNHTDPPHFLKACANCRRRKERCDRRQPCGRCLYRKVPSACLFPHSASALSSSSAPDREDGRASTTTTTSQVTFADAINHGHVYISPLELGASGDNDASTTTGGAAPPVVSKHYLSRLLRDPRGKYMFIGDSANLSFLQSIRKVVEDSIGECQLTKDPLRNQMVEAAPDRQPAWLQVNSTHPSPTLTLAEATRLVRRYFLATNGILDLFDEEDLLKDLPGWLGKEKVSENVLHAAYYLIFAVGAQASSEDMDDLAETCFSYGRYFTFVTLSEEPSMCTVQVYALITMYLLNASRRNAAFMNLGTAVRAAYALGLHRKEIAALFPPPECKIRERLWKTIRILDLFMAASLGRPPSTSETRDTRSADHYSASLDICAIFETILTEIYPKRMISSNVLEKVSEHHRQWSANVHRGLATDGIKPTESIDGGKWPNIGLLHMKESYYWSIMLLTRPFLQEAVSSYVNSGQRTQPEIEEQAPNSSPTKVTTKILVHACVDSAVRTIDLLRALLGYSDLPKRLPFVVNSLFVSALVLGLARFGEVSKSPVEVHLKLAHRLLALFPHDTLARRNASIVDELLQACDVVCEKRTLASQDHFRLLVRGIFGAIHDNQAASRSADQMLEHAHHANGAAESAAELSQAPQSSSWHRNVNDIASMPPLRPGSQAQTQPNALYSGAYPWEQGESGNVADPYMPSMFTNEGLERTFQFMSPTTMWFETYDETIPLFSTVNTTEPSSL